MDIFGSLKCCTKILVFLVILQVLTVNVFVFQLKRERFTEELESYAKQVEEFQTFGDMNEIARYLKKAQSLDNKLTVSDSSFFCF